MKMNETAVAAATSPNVIHRPLVRRHDEQLVTITVQIERRFLPATRSALQEMRDTIARRLENAGTYKWEDAQIAAQVGIAAIAAAVNQQTPKGDPSYAG